MSLPKETKIEVAMTLKIQTNYSSLRDGCHFSKKTSIQNASPQAIDSRILHTQQTIQRLPRKVWLFNSILRIYRHLFVFFLLCVFLFSIRFIDLSFLPDSTDSLFPYSPLNKDILWLIVPSYSRLYIIELWSIGKCSHW